MFDKKYYEDKLKKLQDKSTQVLQAYVDTGIKFGLDIADLNNEMAEVQQLIIQNTIKETPKKDEKTTNLREQNAKAGDGVRDSSIRGGKRA